MLESSGVRQQGNRSDLRASLSQECCRNPLDNRCYAPWHTLAIQMQIYKIIFILRIYIYESLKANTSKTTIKCTDWLLPERPRRGSSVLVNVLIMMRMYRRWAEDCGWLTAGRRRLAVGSDADAKKQVSRCPQPTIYPLKTAICNPLICRFLSSVLLLFFLKSKRTVKEQKKNSWKTVGCRRAFLAWNKGSVRATASQPTKKGLRNGLLSVISCAKESPCREGP